MKVENAKVKVKERRCFKEASSVTRTLVIAGIIFIFAGICTLINAANSASITIGVRFDDVFDGRNPDGSPFEISEVLSDEVLGRAIERLEMKVTAEDLRRHLTVSDLFDQGRVKKGRDNINEGRDAYSDFPSTYQITYSSVSEQIKNEGIISCISVFFKHWGMPSKGKILETVGECAKEVFSENYVIDASAFDINWSGADELDYYNRALYVRKVIGRIGRLLFNEYSNDAAFEAARSAEGFGDIYKKINYINDVSIENFLSYVVKNGVTTNREVLLGQFGYMKDKNIEVYERNMEAYEINKKAIEMYDPHVTKVVFIPSLDSSKNFYMNRTKVGVDYLIENANSAKKAADDAQHNIVNYDYLIAQFSKNQNSDETTHKKADELYDVVKEGVNAVVEEAKVVFDDHHATRYEFLNLSEPEGGFKLTSMIIYGGKLFVWLLLTAFVLVGIFTEIRNRVKR